MSRLSLVAYLFVGLLAMSGCERTRADVGVQRAPTDGGTLVRRLTTDITTLNPIRAATANDRYVVKYLYTPLIYLDRDLQPVPGLATSWNISTNGLTYRFELNEHATFSDGTAVRARDVLFTLRKIADPSSDASQVGTFFSHLDPKRTRVVGDHTIEIAFHEALASQLLHFADLFVLPEHVYSDGEFNRDFNDLAVGSGPYRLIRRTQGKEIVLERRTDYWREKPHVQTIVFKVVSDHSTAWNALKLGQIDETIIASDTWLRERTNPALLRSVNFSHFYTLQYNFIAWNNRHPVLADKRVRRGLAMCIPIDAIVRDVFHGTARPMSGPFTPAEYAFNPHVPTIPYDPAAASRLFGAAGWLDRDADGVLEKDGKPFALAMLIPPGAATAQFAQITQAEMKRVGVRIEIRTIDGAAQVEQIRRGNFDSAYLGWELDADPDLHALFHSSQFPPRGQNFVFYSSAEADVLIDQARQELQPAKRKRLFWLLHAALADDQPYTWTVQVSAKWAISKRVKGVATSEAYGLFNWYPGEFDWWIAPEDE
jgi:peptide/nickel transport system substrate-binding protein